MVTRRRREYLIYLDKAKEAALASVDSFNRVNQPYRVEATLLLLANAWELLAKAILVQAKESITQGQRGDSISAEKAIHKLQSLKKVEKHEAELVQQIVSLRNAAAHQYLPDMPEEVSHHLLYFSSKFFREVIKRSFPSHAKDLDKNYLSITFTDMTTYADKVQRMVSRVKKSENDKRLIWLLNRGIEFDGKLYSTEKQFEAKYRGKKKIMPYLAISDFVKTSDMVRIVPVEAPKNYTADVNLRKGKATDPTLPVVVTKTDIDKDYPYLTKELAAQLGTTVNRLVAIAKDKSMKGDEKYHQELRTSKTGSVHRYSEAAKSLFQQELAR